MRALVSLFGLLPVLTLGAGCALFSAEVDAPEICIGGLALPFPADAADASTEQAISGEELGMPDGDDFDIAVKVRSLSIAPVAGISDLDFMSSMSVRAASADPASDLPGVSIIDMDPGTPQDDGSTVVQPTSPVDISEYLLAGDVLFGVEIAGDRPDTDWLAEMELCVHANARYEM